MSRPAKRLAAVPCVDCGKTTRAWSKRCASCERKGQAPLTWADLVAAEPRLAELEAEARLAHQVPGPKCANRVWYGRPGTPSMKRDFSRLVGWGRPRSAPGPEWLRTSVAYELAYHRLYDLLPCDVGPDGCACSSW
jgi:hypothetical protein